jgi:hypothetical protein
LSFLEALEHQVERELELELIVAASLPRDAADRGPRRDPVPREGHAAGKIVITI